LTIICNVLLEIVRVDQRQKEVGETSQYLNVAHGFVEADMEVEARYTGGNRMRKALSILLVMALLAGVLGFVLL